MADWVDAYQEILEFERRVRHPSAVKSQIVMTKELWQDLRAYNALDAMITAGMDIAEDDKSCG